MRRQLFFEIFAASLSAILLEIAYTRIFSFKVYYSFTYLVIGLGLMGLGAGGALLAASRRLADDQIRGRRPAGGPADERLVSRVCLLGALSVLVGYLVAAKVQLNASALDSELLEVLKLLLISVLIALPFVAVGFVVSLILSARIEVANRLYAADLIGAGLGCSLSIALLQFLDPPRVVLLSGALLAFAALPLARARRAEFAASLLFGVALLVLGTVPRWLPDPVVDRGKGFEDFKSHGLVKASLWNPVFRVDVAEHPTDKDLFLLFHDGLPGSGMRRFPSHAFDHLDESSRKLPFAVLDKPAPRVLIVGSAGGHEVVAALHFGASHVTGVELNSASMSLLTDRYAEITGKLANDPRVTLINGDARWFLEQNHGEYDLIWMVAPDSYAAMNAATTGAFVLAESYLYTVEMIEQIYHRLAPSGILCAQFGEVDFERKPNRTLRFIATAREFYYIEHVPDFEERVLVATSEGLPPFLESTVLLTRARFNDWQVNKFLEHTEKHMPKGVARYLAQRPPDQSVVDQSIVVTQDKIHEWWADQPYQVDPVRDDSPFFWHFTTFRDSVLPRHKDPEHVVDYEDGVGERVLLVMLVLAGALGVLFLLAPLVRIRKTWREMPHKISVAVYFAAIGIGFMFIEVSLIQRLTLLLGYPTRSLSVTLFGLLVSSGIGSALSSRYAKRALPALGLLLAVLFVLLGIWHLVAPRLVLAFLGSALALRVAVALVLVAPLGLCLGGFLPIGLSFVAGASEHRREFVAWAWAVNAFASVVGSILAAILAMAAGFKFLMVAAPVIYVAGVVALLRMERAAAGESSPGAAEAEPILPAEAPSPPP